MQPNKTLAAIAAISVGAATLHAASSIVYSNATSYSGSFVNPGANEIGDEIVLGSGPRYGETFRFEYYGANFHTAGATNETFQLRFYKNDGVLLGGSTYLPNSLFYDSGVVGLDAPTDGSGRATYQLDLTLTTISLPDDFTWSVQFGGIDVGETAGLVIYNPPTVGFSENDFWYNNGTSWELRSTNGAVNFGASLVATSVPEPSTYVLAILGGICGLALINRRRIRNH